MCAVDLGMTMSKAPEPQTHGRMAKTLPKNEVQRVSLPQKTKHEC